MANNLLWIACGVVGLGSFIYIPYLEYYFPGSRYVIFFLAVVAVVVLLIVEKRYGRE